MTPHDAIDRAASVLLASVTSDPHEQSLLVSTEAEWLTADETLSRADLVLILLGMADIAAMFAYSATALYITQKYNRSYDVPTVIELSRDNIRAIVDNRHDVYRQTEVQNPK